MVSCHRVFQQDMRDGSSNGRRRSHTVRLDWMHVVQPLRKAHLLDVLACSCSVPSSQYSVFDATRAHGLEASSHHHVDPARLRRHRQTAATDLPQRQHRHLQASLVLLLSRLINE